ncbi:hypothetical protein [Peribacillus sp. NJ4]|uniref:hypothetical protein n=1 Tax=Peribacillus sp. NJ4 TaxID=3055862 RepID=UPI0025A1AAB2|nr:hypothetical protein [Peribacillus sp. NJ4]
MKRPLLGTIRKKTRFNVQPDSGPPERQERGKSKTYSISIKSEEHKRQMKFLESDDYKERKKVRLLIEHKNAEMKRVHGLTRAKFIWHANTNLPDCITVNVKKASQ